MPAFSNQSVEIQKPIGSNKKNFIKPELAFQQIPLFLVFQFFHLQLLVVIQFTATATIYFDAIELTEEGTTTTTAAI